MAVTLVLVALLWTALNHAVQCFPNVKINIDTQNIPSKLTHNSQLAHLVEEMHLLSRTDRPKLIFLGGSSAEYAFRADAIERAFPGYEAHSLGLNGAYGGGDVAETHEILKAAYSHLSLRTRSSSVFVFGTIMPVFTPSGTDPFFTPARLKLFPRLYKRSGTEAVPRFGMRVTVFFHRLIRPFWIIKRSLMVANHSNSISAGIAWLAGDDANASLSGLETFDDPDNPERRARILKHIEQLRATGANEKIAGESVAALDKMLEFADSRNLRFMVVALPYARDAEDEALAGFLWKIRTMVDARNRSGSLRFLDHSTAFPASLMNDPYHIRQSASDRYALLFRKDWPFEK
jgi:hypothetical protein